MLPPYSAILRTATRRASGNFVKLFPPASQFPPVACLSNTSREMPIRTMNAEAALALDKELMGTGAYSVDGLIELAGLAVSQAVYVMKPPSEGKRVLLACGPGNNGGDGLVAARHLYHYGYEPTVYYPKRPKNDLYQRLTKQLEDLNIAFTDDFSSALADTDQVVDAVFGFSFSGKVREPFPKVIEALKDSKVPVLAVDVPSSWDIETGPPDEGAGKDYMPDVLVSMTAPKPLVRHFSGKHFVGGRFLSKTVADKYGVDVPPYKGIDQIAEVPVEAQ